MNVHRSPSQGWTDDRSRLRRAVATGAAAVAALLLLAAPAHAAGLVDSLTALDGKLAGKSSLTGAERQAVHRDKAALIAAHYAVATTGTTYAEVLTRLDCVDTNLQRARNAARASAAARARVAAARGCQRKLAAALTPSAALRADLDALRAHIGAVIKAAAAGKVFGAKATAIRHEVAALVKRHFPGSPVGGVSFAESFADLECIDVKLEAGRISGASSCARRLVRLLKAAAAQGGGSAPAAVSFGSDLTGDPVAIKGSFQEDTEFWTQGVSAPADGTVTQFKLKIGNDPETLPLRFSVVRPQPDGTVKVITTSNPPYELPGNKPGVYTFSTSALSFTCCAVQKGDIVTVDNRGTTTPDPYVWFAQRPGFTTFSHTAGGLSQNPGEVWRGTPHDGYELLLALTLQPNP